MLILIGIGAIASVTHLGRPQNMMYMLGNPTSSLVMEGIFAGLTGLAVLVDLALTATKKQENRIVVIIAAVLAVALMCVQAYAYATSFGNAAWRGTSVWTFFILGSIGAGFPLWLLFGDVKENKAFASASCTALIAAAAAFAWEAAMFAGAGAQTAQMIFGAVLAVIAAVCAYLGGAGKFKAGPNCAVVLAIVALAVARYGFYMASIL